MSGIGTIDNPLDLATALQISNPGQTFLLRGGTYSLNLTSSRNGLSGYRITFKNYPGEIPVVDGSLNINGEYQRWQGIEFTDSTNLDRSVGSGKTGINIAANHNEIINCRVKNFAQGIQSGASISDVLVYGTLVYYNGWDSSLGHGLYPQNSTPYKKFINSIVFNNFAYGFHIWSGAGNVDYFWLEKNTVFDNGIYNNPAYLNNIQVGGATSNQGHRVFENWSYYSGNKTNGANRIGYGTGSTVTDTQITDNLFTAEQSHQALNLVDCVPDVMTGNAIYGPIMGFDSGDYPDNTYGAFGTHADQYEVIANDYDSNLATLRILNPSQASSVSIDVSGVFGSGDNLKVRNAQDFLTDIQNLTVAGDGTINVDMQAANRSIERPTGTTDWTPAKIFPKAGVFVLEKV